ncbi:MAG: thioredoxin family protein [bacterium]
MSATQSTMLALGTQAPDFSLKDVRNDTLFSLKDFAGQKGLLVMFMCAHCPYVKHIQEEIARVGNDFVSKGIAVIAISSNDAENHPDDGPEGLKAMAEKLGFNFPYGYDETQSVAKDYRAACTPEFYLFDQNQKLYYRGQFDESRPKNTLPVTGKDLRAALESLLKGSPAPTDQKPGLGCNIKWKKGNEPDYFG